MPTCFLIQPFDKGKFDKRYDGVYEPAIRAAGFDPYRVDRDDGVTVPIKSIEEGIRAADVCLADITSDNPNVWYELGFASAARRPVVMVCSEERTSIKFPFDIQHRAIVTYKAEAPSDFTDLQTRLTAKIQAITDREAELEQIAEFDLITPVAGLTQPEFMLVAVLAGALYSPDSSLPLWTAKQDAEKARLTALGFNLALRRLIQRGFVLSTIEHDPMDGESYSALSFTDSAWDWIDANESRFVVHNEPVQEVEEEEEDEIPF